MNIHTDETQVGGWPDYSLLLTNYGRVLHRNDNDFTEVHPPGKKLIPEMINCLSYVSFHQAKGILNNYNNGYTNVPVVHITKPESHPVVHIAKPDPRILKISEPAPSVEIKPSVPKPAPPTDVKTPLILSRGMEAFRLPTVNAEVVVLPPPPICAPESDRKSDEVIRSKIGFPESDRKSDNTTMDFPKIVPSAAPPPAASKPPDNLEFPSTEAENVGVPPSNADQEVPVVKPKAPAKPRAKKVAPVDEFHKQQADELRAKLLNCYNNCITWHQQLKVEYDKMYAANEIMIEHYTLLKNAL